jgi:hypothetical protein
MTATMDANDKHTDERARFCLGLCLKPEYKGETEVYNKTKLISASTLNRWMNKPIGSESLSSVLKDKLQKPKTKNDKYSLKSIKQGLMDCRSQLSMEEIANCHY